MNNIVFESNNIIYVNVREELIDDYLKMINDPDVQKWISNERKVYTYDEELKWVLEKLENNDLIFSMIEKDTNEYIGNIEIMNINNKSGEIGICITSNKQNMHYGEESIERIISYAKDVIKLDNIYLNVFKTNKRAIKCYEKVGFVIDGIGKSSNDWHMTYIGVKKF